MQSIGVLLRGFLRITDELTAVLQQFGTEGLTKLAAEPSP